MAARNTSYQTTKELLKIEEAGHIASLGKTKIWALIADGTLEVVRLGPRCTRVKRSSIDKLISGVA